MSKHIINAGATSQRFYIYLQDSTTGQGELSVTGATCFYVRDAVSGTMPAAVTLTFGASFASPGTYPAWSSGQVRELAYMPGLYLVDLPDAIFAAGARNAIVQIFPTSGTPWLPVNLEFTLSSVNLFDSVRMGMTALPNTSVTTNGSLITSGSGTDQLSVTSGNVAVGSIATNAITAASIATGAIDADSIAADAITAAKIATGAIDADAIAADAITAAKIATGAIDADAIAADAITSAKIANSAISIRLVTDGTPSEARIETGAVAADVWNALLASYTTANTFGARIVRTRSTSPSNEVTITGSFHIAADVHEIQPATITAADFAAGAIDANALATDAVTEIAAGTWAYDISAFSTVGQAGTYLKNAMPTSTYTAPPTAVANADALLGRNIAGGSDGGRTVKDALRALRNKSEIVGTTLTVYQENDTTSAWTATVSSSASADPVTGIDPA